MSDQHPNHEDIARMLREQGPVQAPPDLADEVMRTVRAESVVKPGRRWRMRLSRPLVLVPALGAVAVAGIVAAVVFTGGPATQSSAESAALLHTRADMEKQGVAAGGGTAATLQSNGEKGVPDTPSTHGAATGAEKRMAVSVPGSSLTGRYFIPLTAARGLTTYGVVTNGVNQPYFFDQNLAAVPWAPLRVSLTVAPNRYQQAASRLSQLSAAYARNPAAGPPALVILHRKP